MSCQKSSVYLISLPPKIWQPKVTPKYKTLDQANDIDYGIFDYAAFGKLFFSPRYILGICQTEWLDIVYQWSWYSWTREKSEDQK